MENLLDTEDTPLIRTAFGNDVAWRTLLTEIARESPDGFRAYVSIIDDPSLSGAAPESLAEAVAPGHRHAIVLVADEGAMNVDDQTVLVVDVRSPSLRFRSSLPALWSVQNNLSIANLDFEDFTEALDEGGVYRGF